MSRRTIEMTEALHGWLVDNTVHETAVQRTLRAWTATHPEGRMQSAPEQCQLMALLMEVIGARQAIEVGVFTGYGALTMALALPPEGRLVACESEAAYLEIAQRHWDEAGVADRIEPRLGPAAETLQSLLDSDEEGAFDFMYVDADKTGYDGYVEQGLRLVRPGGLIALDNMLHGGRVADETESNPSTVALRALNEKLHADKRVAYSLVPIGDGLGLALRRT